MISTKYKNLSILIVEDDLSSAEQFKDVFKIYFDHIYLSHDGCDALDIIEKYSPNIIISDINLPCMSGIEMIEHLKNGVSQNKDIIFILITAYTTKENLLKSINTIQVDAFFSKPVELKKVLLKIEELLNNKNLNFDIEEILSPKEFLVFLDFANGLKLNNIANKYNIKPKTVSTYKLRILNKLNLKTTTDLVYYAIKNNYISI